MIPIVAHLTVQTNQNNAQLRIQTNNQRYTTSLDTQLNVSNYEPFAGPYIVTPTQSTQVLQIENKRATENIIVNPIPSNYGLITWNGSFITVS